MYDVNMCFCFAFHVMLLISFFLTKLILLTSLKFTKIIDTTTSLHYLHSIFSIRFRFSIFSFGIIQCLNVNIYPNMNICRGCYVNISELVYFPLIQNLILLLLILDPQSQPLVFVLKPYQLIHEQSTQKN